MILARLLERWIRWEMRRDIRKRGLGKAKRDFADRVSLVGPESWHSMFAEELAKVEAER